MIQRNSLVAIVFLVLLSYAHGGPRNIQSPHAQHKQHGTSDDTSTPNTTYKGLYLRTYAFGTLVKVPASRCQKLRIYFPGHAQELGFKGEVPQNREREWAETMLSHRTNNYELAEPIRKSECPVLILGDSNKSLSSDQLKSILTATEASEIEIMSHSGGYAGLDTSLNNWTAIELSKIKSIKLLDNFYTKSLAITLSKKITNIVDICSGFYTPHNSARYNKDYKDICPNAKARNGSEHKRAVKDFF